VRLPSPILAVLPLLAICCPSANANISIDPTFNSSITSDPNTATIEAGIDQAISSLESFIATLSRSASISGK
jgi:hypothetical protein